MKGNWKHNMIADTAVDQARRQGLLVQREYPIAVHDRTCFGDIYISAAGGRVLIEVETSSKRIVNDIRKAQALDAELWILVPSCSVRMSVVKKLAQLDQLGPGKCVLLISEIFQRLALKFDLKTGPIEKRKR